MGSCPTVSVVLPTCNRAHVLPRSIYSVLCQTYKDFELIIVDDASTDNTEKVVKAIEDGRILFEKMKKKVGAAEARNVGIRMARGEIVAFQDSDDEWTCSKLERCVELINDNQSVSGVFSAFVQIRESECRLMPYGGTRSSVHDRLYESLLWRNVVGTPTLVIKRDLLEEVGGFDPSMPRYQDWDLALRVAQVSRLRYIQEPLILAFVTGGSITENENSHRVALEKIYEKHNVKINEDRRLKASWLHRLGDARFSAGLGSGRRTLMAAAVAEPTNVRYVVKCIFAFVGSQWLYRQMLSLFRRKRK